MTTTTKLGIPLMDANQNQKYVTHNDAVLFFDILVQLNWINSTTATPPGSPTDGDTYLIATSPTGAWSGKAGNITSWTDGAWKFFPPFSGMTGFDVAAGKLKTYISSAWTDFGTAAGLVLTSSLTDGSLAELGVNASPDATNKFAVASSAILFNNIGANCQVKLNKHAVGDTASFLYQDNFSGRAEIGLCGDDSFHFKVSPDGSSWTDALIIDKTTGIVSSVGVTITANNSLKFTSQTSGAAANTGTLTNSPATGNPAFWVPVVINGSNRYIPAW